jgi:hypothetical protein
LELNGERVAKLQRFTFLYALWRDVDWNEIRFGVEEDALIVSIRLVA